MTVPVPAAGLSAALVALLALACAVAGADMADAAPLPRSVPMTAEFDGLRVGDSASRSWAVDIREPSLITDAVIRRDVSGTTFRWRAELCPAAGGTCIDLLGAPDGASLDAGKYVLGLGVTMVAFGSTEAQSIEGQLTFVERSTGSLAFTGSGSVRSLGVGAAAVIALGILLILVARRRSRAHRTGDAR